MAPPPFNRPHAEPQADDLRCVWADLRSITWRSTKKARSRWCDWSATASCRHRVVVPLLWQLENHDHGVHRRRSGGHVEHVDRVVDRWSCRRNFDEHAVAGLRAWLSGAIHVINYYRDEVRSGGKSGARRVVPCDTHFCPAPWHRSQPRSDLISLSTSNLAPISNFGLYSAIGVIATLAILFSYLPAALQTFAPNFATLTAGANVSRTDLGRSSTNPKLGCRRFGRRWVVGSPRIMWP